MLRSFEEMNSNLDRNPRAPNHESEACFGGLNDNPFDFFMDSTYFEKGSDSDSFAHSPNEPCNQITESPPNKRPRLADKQSSSNDEPVRPKQGGWIRDEIPSDVTVYEALLTQSQVCVTSMQRSIELVVAKLFRQQDCDEASSETKKQRSNASTAQLGLLTPHKPRSPPSQPTHFPTKVPHDIGNNGDASTIENGGSPGEGPAEDRYSMILCEDTPVPNVWYCDRPFPRLSVQVLRGESKMHATNMDNFEVRLSLINGFGVDSTDKAYGNLSTRSYQICNTTGRVNVIGLRFNAVSSKQGGHFRLRLCLVWKYSQQGNQPCATDLTSNPKQRETARVEIQVCEWKSDPIQVLSYRLYHAPKVPSEQLRGSDSISKMRGIGSQYAQRLKSVGIITVQDLAAIDFEAMGEASCEALLQRIRKDRGAMTLAKLSGYMAQARDICRTSDDATPKTCSSWQIKLGSQ